MKSKKPKKAKAAVKRTRTSAAKQIPRKSAGPKPTMAAGPAATVKRSVPREKPAQAKSPAKADALLAPPTPQQSIEKAAQPVTAQARRGPRRLPPVPPILLEGDAPSLARPSGPGMRYVMIGTGERLATPESGELPEAYGTQRLLLVARDPQWLYAHWDMTTDQLRAHNAESRDGHLVVRVFRDHPEGELVLEQHVHPESRNWFIHVRKGGVRYVASLGYYDRRGHWINIVTSGATITPPDVLSEDTSVRFETIPIDVPFSVLLEAVKAAVVEHVPLVEAIQELRQSGHVELPALTETEVRQIRSVASSPAVAPPRWTAQQERALAQVINIDAVRRVWMGSLEITELIRRQIEHELASQAAAAAGVPPGGEQPGGVSSISSPFGGEARRKGFWFNVNAELIIYGATEPDAVVSIGGRKIQLRRDGTFSFRFALPDGSYELPVQARSADGSDSRQAQLQFHRATEYRGDVGRHPQDATLKTPRVENVS